jgi:aminoglycoside phosphotransferase (APT) family kinase protein
MRSWTAEVEVDEPLVRRLLSQFPELAARSVVRISEGWDRSVWLVDSRWVFGFPRRSVVVPGLERELEFLPRLAPLLPLPIPVPVFAGSPTEEFPWPFAGSEFLPGRELGEVELEYLRRNRVAIELADFLCVLHSSEVAEAIGVDTLPPDGNRRADMALLVPRARATLQEVELLGLWRIPPMVFLLLEEAEQLPPPEREHAVVHGDLHFRHLLVDGRRATGVIDWIDLCRGDPAIDLQLLWSFVPPARRAAFLHTYGAVADDQLARARIVALALCGVLAVYGHQEGMPAIERAAVVGLDLAATN